MVGVFAAMPVLWGWMELKKVYLFFIAIGVLLVPMTLDRLSTFSHPYLLWDDAEKLVHGKEGLPGIDRIYYNRGTELIALQRYEDAIADFNVGLAANPKLDHLYGNRGSAYLHLEKYPEALRDYDKAIELNAENSKYYYGRGLILQKLNNIEAARTNFQKSCDLANRGCNKLKELPQTP
jgi:tetratricopeptide (TPR) repeat protein